MAIKRVLAFSIMVVTLLVGCSGANYAPVDDRVNRSQSSPGRYVVSQGETLYSIAWRYGIDYKQLANANGISEPYTIYSGQTLLLKAAKNSKKVAVRNKPTARKATVKKPPVRSSSPSKSTQKPVSKTLAKGYPFRWQWPAGGKLTKRFSLSGNAHKGIDLKGKLRDSVIAANSGKVVYAGSGLVGYGKLLIIKHNDQFLSAYGHNHRLLVSEGQMVKVGQAIAEMGNTGTDVVKLHFEIRKNGKPVDPVKYLPRRT